MFTFLTSRRKHRTRPSQRRPSLHLEGLEERTVPTVVFTPQFGAESLAGNSSNNALQSPPTEFIFWGSYWSTSPGSQYQSALLGAAQNVINSPYLVGLEQYGGDGKSIFRASWTDSSDPPVGFQPSDVSNEINKAIADPNSPIDVPNSGSPIYVVVTPPTKGLAGGAGYNQGGSTWIGLNYESYHFALVRTATPNNVDQFSVLFSHEFAESVSNSVVITQPASLPLNLHGDDQISDNEPNGTYVYRLNGVLVQAYWSQQDLAYIVPDGNSETLTLNPIWNVTWTGPSFSGTSNVMASGDQFANKNDFFQVNQTATGGVFLNLSGEAFTFDAGAVNQLNIDTGGGQNGVTIYGVPSGVSLNVHSSGNSSDNVVIGSNGTSLASVAGSVQISNGSGHTALTVNDGGDTVPRTVTVTDSQVNFQGLANISYKGAMSSNGQYDNVTSLKVIGSQGGNTFDVLSTAANTPLSLDSGTGNYHTDNVVIGNNGSLAGIAAPVNVSNSSGNTNLTINDSAESYRNIMVTNNSVSFDGVVTINYTPAATDPGTGLIFGVTNLTIDDGTNGGNTVFVESVGAMTTTKVKTGPNDLVTGPAANQVQLI
jgi:hypothetical protein